MRVQFGNNWTQKIPLTAKLDSATILAVSEFCSSSYFQIGQHVVLLHILIGNKTLCRLIQSVIIFVINKLDPPLCGCRISLSFV